jgi:hypothetical protein
LLRHDNAPFHTLFSSGHFHQKQDCRPPLKLFAWLAPMRNLLLPRLKIL